MRRGVRDVLGASAAVLCLGALFASCGGGSGDGYVATGAAGASPERAPGKAVAPTGDVRLIPLDGDRDTRRPAGSAGPAKNGRGAPTGPPSGPKAAADGDSEGKSPGGTNAPPPEASPSPGGGTADPPPKRSPGPAELRVGEPLREPTAKRWCEKVTLTFHNTGGSPVCSGKITFGTHIIGALGVDWATANSTRPLPAPIAAGERVKKKWLICTAKWRVPLGMHTETQDIHTTWT
ncbi:hypothetical protein [Streptomyces sp. DSM 118878]